MTPTTGRSKNRVEPVHTYRMSKGTNYKLSKILNEISPNKNKGLRGKRNYINGIYKLMYKHLNCLI